MQPTISAQGNALQLSDFSIPKIQEKLRVLGVLCVLCVRFLTILTPGSQIEREHRPAVGGIGGGQ